MSVTARQEVLDCQVKAIERLTPFVFKVVLKPEQSCPFLPGQYVHLVMPDQSFRTFSLANIPSKNTNEQYVELHIGATPDNPYTWEVIQHLKDNLAKQQVVHMTLPEGKAYLREAQRPLLVLVGGTGFSYGWSIAQGHLDSQSQQPLYFFWGARKQGDLYAHSSLLDKAAQDTRFLYFPVLEEIPQGWQGSQGLVHLAALDKTPDLADRDVYTAGRFKMVRVVRDAFFAKGLPEEQFYSDALPFLDDL